MDTMVMEPVVDEAPVVKILPLMVPTPTPSELFQKALDDGFRLRHGVYWNEEHKEGCAIGAIFHGMVISGLTAGVPFERTLGQHGTRIYMAIIEAFPDLGYTTLTKLEQGFECHRWSQDRCVDYLKDQGF